MNVSLPEPATTWSQSAHRAAPPPISPPFTPPFAPQIAPPPFAPQIAPPTSGERVTVLLIPPVLRDLQELQEHTELSVTDLTNRAITLYAFYDRQSRAGRSFLMRDDWTGELQLVQLF